MSEQQFHVNGNHVRIGNYTYFKSHLEKKQPHNAVGLSRYNRSSGKYETYNPHETLKVHYR